MMAAPSLPARFCTGVLLALAGHVALAADYPGLVQPLHDIVLSSGVGGVVSSRMVHPGSRVAARQVLMVLDDRLQSVEAERREVILQDTSELKATEERLRISRGLYEDAKRVYDKTGSISKDELARLEADYLATQGRLEQLQAQKEREKLEHQGAVQERQMRRVVAPVGGVVTKVDIEVGEWAKPGEPLVRLVDASTLIFKANLPMPAVSGLQVGSVLPVLVEDGAHVVQVGAHVTFISPVADAASGLVEVRANIANPNNRLRAGSKAVLRIVKGGAAEPSASGGRL
jgi:RND family efflux transporter MFP subunit